MGIIKMKDKSIDAAMDAAIEQSADALQANAANRSQMQEAEPYEDPAIRFEDETQTDEKSRLFYYNNGTAKSVISAAPVNFFDEQEKAWKRIDNTLEDKGDVYVTKAGACKTEITKAHVKKSVKVQKKDKEIAWTFLGKQSAAMPCALSAQSAPAVTSVLQVENKADRAKSYTLSRAVYENAETQTDIEYCLHGNGVKENIIVKEKSDEYRYVFALDTKGLQMRLSEDNTQIELYSDEKTEFVIPAPYMFDSNGATSDEVFYELDPTSADGYAFAVVANAEWINADERALPVTIDPQIVTDTSPLITKRTQYRYRIGSSYSSYSSWYDTSEDVIRVNSSNGMEYRTQITVKRSYLKTLNNRISSVKLLLSPTLSNSGYLYIDNQRTYYNTASGKLTINLTSRFKNTNNDFSFWLEPISTAFVFSMSAVPPVLEVEYLTNEKSKPCTRKFALSETVGGIFDVPTGELNAEAALSSGDGLTVPYGITLVHKASAENFNCGNGFRLNLHERLQKNSDDAIDANYVYTDVYGMQHGFTENYYRLNESNNKVAVDKKSVTVQTDGTLTDEDGNKVFKEELSDTGWKASTKLEGVENVELFEQRQNEIKQLEEQIEAYENMFDEYVSTTCEGTIRYYLKYFYANKVLFDRFLSYTNRCYIMTESEAYSLLGMHLQTPKNAAIDSQMAYMRNKTDKNIKQLKQYYREYINRRDELKLRKNSTPVNYLTNGTIVKGYNEKGDLVAIADSYQNAVMIERDKKNRIVSIYDNQEHAITFTYNGKGRLSAVTDVRGKRTALGYDANGNLQKITYADGKTVTFTATASLFTQVQSSEKVKTVLGYKGTRLASLTQTSTTNGIAHGSVTVGNVTLSALQIEYGVNQTTVRETAGAPRAEQYQFDANGNCNLYLAEENGKVVKAEEYDYEKYARDNTKYAKKDTLYTTSLAQYSFVADEYENVTLNAFNNPTQRATGWKTIYKDEATDNQTKQRTSTEYVYDDNHCVIEERTRTETQKNSATEVVIAVTKYSYNAQGSVVRVENYIEGEELSEGKAIEETVYDQKGRVVKSFAYNSLDSSSKLYKESEYDENGKTIAEKDQTGENKTTLEYVDNTNIVRSKTLPNGSTFAYGYNESDVVTAITQSTAEGEENSTQTAYTCGAVTQVQSGNNTVRYAYDGKRRKTSVELNGTQYMRYTYADNVSDGGKTVNNVTAKLCNNDTVETTTDMQGNVLRIRYNATPQVTAVYDEIGKVKTRTDGVTNVTATYTYDKLDRVTGITGGEIGETYVYDEYGNTASKRITVNGKQTEYVYAYKNNAAKDLESVTVGDICVSPATDMLGRATGKTITVNGVKIAEEHISYRKAGDHATEMPSTLRFGHRIPSAAPTAAPVIPSAAEEPQTQFVYTDSIKYTYDACGNISAVHENGKLAARYEYDALQRLTREDNKQLGKTTLYAYDNNGNILCKREFAFTLQERARLEERESTDMHYAYQGDRLLGYGNETFAYDMLGNPTVYRGKTCVWEKGRQLKSYNNVTFAYDGQGRRTAKGNITYTYDHSGNLLAQSNGLQFIHDHSGVAGVVYNGAEYFYRKNVQGDIVGIVDKSGKNMVKYVYDAWGNHAVEVLDSACAELSQLNPYRYRGYYYDTETGLYFLKTRYYDPEVGRFITIDDLSYIDPETINGLNLYAYCTNNPVMNIDPNGTWSWKKFWKKTVGWVATAAIAIAGVALVVGTVAALAVGTMATGGILPAVLIGVGLGAVAGVGMGIANQGGLSNIKNMNPWKVAGAGFVGSIVGGN